MGVDLSACKKIAEGKTKGIYENPQDPKTVYMVFKDDITAGDGAKHDVIEGKALVEIGNVLDKLENDGQRLRVLASAAAMTGTWDEAIKLCMAGKRYDAEIDAMVESKTP